MISKAAIKFFCPAKVMFKAAVKQGHLAIDVVWESVKKYCQGMVKGRELEVDV